MNETDLVEKVIEWAREKGILEKGTFEGQFLKCVEEMEEVADAFEVAVKNPGKEEIEHLMTELGDLLVTVILLCKVTGSSPASCLGMAYRKIKNRKGKMVDGQFVRERNDD